MEFTAPGQNTRISAAPASAENAASTVAQIICLMVLPSFSADRDSGTPPPDFDALHHAFFSPRIRTGHSGAARAGHARPAANEQCLAGNKAAFAVEQEQDGTRDILRRANSPDKNAVNDGLALGAALRVAAIKEIARDRARNHHVDSNAIAAHLDRHGARHADKPGFGARIHRAVGLAEYGAG